MIRKFRFVLVVSSLFALCVSPAWGASKVACKVKSKPVGETGSPVVRKSARRGLSYLAKASHAWTKKHKCFGCHVQAVTLEAQAVGRHHQYQIANKDIDNATAALRMGVTAGGRTTGYAFEGAAWARYDKWIKNDQTKQLLDYAGKLVVLQAEDGSIRDDDARKPITGGTMHTTYQATQTWRQAYARTADDKWLSPIRKAERYLSKTSRRWKNGRGVYIQDINFALLGLTEAGVRPSEMASLRLQRMLLSRQNNDGGWGLSAGNKSDAFATGQTVYALKLAGFSDQDLGISRGLRFLTKAQGQDGSWRTVKSGQHGSEKGETMWAVLGLVSVDVMSLHVAGLRDGQHVQPRMKLRIKARDNQGRSIARVEIFVDDLLMQKACGKTMTHTWDTTKLSSGKHIVDIVATNSKGQQSRRRFEVYAGDVFVTRVGAVFDDKTLNTRVSLRNIATAKTKGSVVLEVWSLKGKSLKPKKRLTAQSQKSLAGAMTFDWTGKNKKGKAMPRGRYLAKILFRDAAGKVRQTETTVFFHDAESVQRKRFGEVAGRLALKKGTKDAANTILELVDKDGNVVQTTRSTAQGNYRFKNVDKGSYKVRARKKGFRDIETQADVSAGEAAPASMSW